MGIGVFRNRLQGGRFSIDRCSERDIDVVVSKECQVEVLVIRRFDVFVVAYEVKKSGYRLKEMTNARFQFPWL